MSLFARLKKAREEKKGFTLVELIVVLVILAILAAMLVPALLGWIDEARNKQYVLEARNICTAAQAAVDEGFANGDVSDTTTDLTTYVSTAAVKARIAKLADTDDDNLTFADVTASTTGGAHTNLTIGKMQVAFLSQNGKYVGATLNGDSWTVKVGSSAQTPETYASAG